MENGQRICGNCRYYDAYYTKGISQFEIQKIGRCALFEKTLDKYEYCSAWQSNEQRLKTRRAVAEKELSELLERTSQLKQILEETER